MACIVSSGSIQLELLVVGMSTSLTSSMQPVLGYRAQWFESWQPSQDTLSITFRQSTPEAHESAVATLRRWAQGNSRLSLKYPERNIDYEVIIRSIPWTRRYDTQLVDATVTFQPLTNRFIDSTSPFIYANLAWSMLGSEFITEDIDDISSFETETQVRALFASKTQFDGYDITYLSYPNIQIRYRMTIVHEGQGLEPDTVEQTWSSVYTVQLTTQLAGAISRGEDISAYLKAHADDDDTSGGTPTATPVPGSGNKKTTKKKRKSTGGRDKR